MKLNAEEKRVRILLVRTAKGIEKTHAPGLISYSELWARISAKPWGRGQRSKIVNLISRISSFELLNRRPPLNEIVVRKGTYLPGEPWEAIARQHEEGMGVEVPYKSHEDAQEACWFYWRSRRTPAERSRGFHDLEGEEGFQQDRTTRFRKRNAALIAERKKRDNHTCQSCGFFVKVNGKNVIDCHHSNPLGLGDSVRVTRISQLVCLCPSCHRIAHTSSPPLKVEQIEAVLKKQRIKGMRYR